MLSLHCNFEFISPAVAPKSRRIA
ncbi:hypothetical protein RSAG8_13890, partial [Rhizoctonia solani AG-8 WAC10335]